MVDITFDNWIRPMRVISIEGNQLTVELEGETDPILVDHIAKRYNKILTESIYIVAGQLFEIHFVPQKMEQMEMNLDAAMNLMNDTLTDNAYSNINPRYTFDTFVVGSNNRFAHSVALSVAESPGGSYNPFYVHGGPGLGKTHLMQAIGNFILTRDPTKKVLYVTSEEFVNEVINAIRNNREDYTAMSRLREKYRSVDVLMIDDIQFIIGKESTQEEFFNTFNALHSVGKQIVISSDRPPKDMETLAKRYTSRFMMGMIADIGLPDYETRMAILQKKAAEDRLLISNEVFDYIATNLQTNVRELEGALNKVLAVQKMQPDITEVTLDIAKKELHDFITPDAPKEITPQLIIEVVAEHYGLTIEQMQSKSRSSSISKPRQIAMYLCKEMTDESLDGVGSFLGGRDHSTIIHGATKISKEYEENEAFRQEVDIVKKKINPGDNFV